MSTTRERAAVSVSFAHRDEAWGGLGNATGHFGTTWAEVARWIEWLCRDTDEVDVVRSVAVCRALCANLRYLEGLGSLLLYGNQRDEIGRLGKAVRAVEMSALFGNDADVARSLLACWDRFVHADRTIGFPYHVYPDGVPPEGVSVERTSLPPGRLWPISPWVWEAHEAVAKGGRAFTWYRLRRALRHRRLRSAARLFREWLAANRG